MDSSSSYEEANSAMNWTQMEQEAKSLDVEQTSVTDDASTYVGSQQLRDDQLRRAQTIRGSPLFPNYRNTIALSLRHPWPDFEEQNFTAEEFNARWHRPDRENTHRYYQIQFGTATRPVGTPIYGNTGPVVEHRRIVSQEMMRSFSTIGQWNQIEAAEQNLVDADENTISAMLYHISGGFHQSDLEDLGHRPDEYMIDPLRLHEERNSETDSISAPYLLGGPQPPEGHERIFVIDPATFITPYGPSNAQGRSNIVEDMKMIEEAGLLNMTANQPGIETEHITGIINDMLYEAAPASGPTERINPLAYDITSTPLTRSTPLNSHLNYFQPQ